MRWGKTKAAPGNARPGMLPEARGLLAEPIEHGGHGEGTVCRTHLGSSLCAEGYHGFARGVPACVERGKVCFPACSFMSRPPVSEPLVPALCFSGAADADRGPPYGSVSIGVHQTLLPAY